MTKSTIQLRFFASIREAVGHGSEDWSTEAANLGALRDELIARGAPYADSLSRARAVRMAVDQTMCDESHVVSAGAEVAFFPPVTGG